MNDCCYSFRRVMVQRYVCWMHTTPTILLLVKMISTSITRQQAVRAVVCVETMLLTGLAGSLTAGWWTGEQQQGRRTHRRRTSRGSGSGRR